MKRFLFILISCGLLVSGCNSNPGNTAKNKEQNNDTLPANNAAGNNTANTATAIPNNNNTAGAGNNVTLPANTPVTGPMVRVGKSHWVQNEQDDLKIHKKMYFANVSVSQPLHFKSGPVDAELRLKYKDGKNEAVLRIEKGEFGKNKNNTNLKAVFDSISAANYHSEVSEYMPNCIIIKDADKLISQIKKSKTLVFETDVTNEGIQKIAFEITGLNWNH